MNLGEKGAIWPVSLARMMIGILWLFSLRWKLPPNFVPGEGLGLMDWLLLEAQHPAFAFYGDFVSSIVIPNFTIFAWIIFLTELLVGLLLLTGTLTRIAGLLGLLLALNLGIGLLEVPGEWPWSYLMLAMWQGTFIVTAAGRTLGIDGWLRKRYGNNSWLAWVS